MGADDEQRVPDLPEAAQPPIHVFDAVCERVPEVSRQLLEQILTLAAELAREGREGRKIGTIFTVGDADRVLERSRCLILDPLAGHPPDRKRVSDADTRETLKELSQLDGAFVISSDGVAVSAARYLDAPSHGIDLPRGLGTRHMAAASITRDTDAVAVVVSQSSVVRVFQRGELISEVLPEAWMLSRYPIHVRGPYQERTDREVTVVSRSEVGETG